MKKIWTLLAAVSFCLSSVAIEQVNGWYQIRTAQDLADFAGIVNGGTTNIKGALMNDIDLSGVDNFTPIGLFSDAGTNFAFNGVFDGQGHIISNLKVFRDDDIETGFFSRAIGATISNLGFMGDISITNTKGIRCGVLGGEIVLCSVNNVFVRANSITLNSESPQRGALAGEGASSTFTSCYTTEATFTGVDNGVAAFNNCCNNADGKIAAKAASGELCATLGKGWYQNVDNGQTPDEWPTFDSSHGVVYLTCDKSRYSNNSGHVYKNGICQNCSQYEEPGFDKDMNAYTIGNLGQLIYFSRIVNTSNQYANGSLTSDIDMEFSDKFTPIGLNNDADKSTPFRGTFYGNNHVIRNIYVKTDCEGGLFSRLIEGKIYNLGVENGHIESTANLRCGAIAGEHHISYMYNCFARGTFEFVTTHAQQGALAAEAANGHFVNCYTTLAQISCAYPMDGSTQNSYEGVTAEQAATGELCYKLGDAFRQTIGADTYPELSETSAPVSYVGEAGYATFFDAANGYQLGGDVKAYVAVAKNNWLNLTEIENVPAGTPVILKGTFYNKVAKDVSAIDIVNELKGATADTEANGVMYVLAKVDGKVGFYLAKAGTTIAAGKAYYEAAVDTKAFFFAENGETAINSLTPSLSEGDGAVYNLSGQRVNKAQKGIYIVNGKKVLK